VIIERRRRRGYQLHAQGSPEAEALLTERGLTRCQCRLNFPQKRRSKFPQVRAWVIRPRSERDLWVWADDRVGAAVVAAAAG
jgi:hypothetical protein